MFKARASSAAFHRSDWHLMSSSSHPNASISRKHRKMGNNHKHEKKAAPVFPESEEENGVEEEELEIERWSDGSDCMWLSSDSKSSSFSLDDDGSWDVFSIDSQALFSMTRNYNPFLGKQSLEFDGSSVNPIEEASLLLDRTLKSIAWQDEMKEEVVAWLLNSVGDDFKESSSASLESVGSSFNKSLNEDSLVFHGSLKSSVADDGSEVRDFDMKQTIEPDDLQCDFHCSSHKNNWNSEAGCSDSSVPSLSENLPSESVPETTNLDEFDTNGPLFWPIEQKFNWSSELSRDLFIMSPLKNGGKVGNLEGFFAPKSIRLSLQDSKKHREKGLLRPQATVATVPECITKDVKKNLRTINTMPSRLGKSMQYSITKTHLKISTDPSTDSFFSEYKDFLGEDFRSSEEIPIEKMVGLDEFDGHEGIDTELIEDCFLLDESPNNDQRTLPF